MANSINHIDCFSGPGGIATGFRAAGIDTALAIEKVKCCVDTYSYNHPDVPIINKDIRFVENDEILEAIQNQKIDIVTAGFPCETFSTAGSKSRSFYDHRQFLYQEAIRIAVVVDADVVLFENVPAIQTKKAYKDGNVLIVDQIKEDLVDAGYKNLKEFVLSSDNFGVPQKRGRYFILATKHENVDLDKNVISTFPNKVTVSEAFTGLPFIEANSGECHEYDLKITSQYSKLMKDDEFWKINGNSKLTYHIAPKHRPNTIKRLKLVEQGEGLKDLFFKFPEEEVKRLQEDKILPNKWYIQRNRRIFADRPSPTVTSHCLDELVHPHLNRSLTIREVARLQSFPDSYEFAGGPMICPHMAPTQDKYEQVGDAVPPLLAYHWGLHLKEIIKEVANDVKSKSREAISR